MATRTNSPFRSMSEARHAKRWRRPLRFRCWNPLGHGFDPAPAGDPGRWRHWRGGTAMAMSPAGGRAVGDHRPGISIRGTRRVCSSGRPHCHSGAGSHAGDRAAGRRARPRGNRVRLAAPTRCSTRWRACAPSVGSPATWRWRHRWLVGSGPATGARSVSMAN